MANLRERVKALHAKMAQYGIDMDFLANPLPPEADEALSRGDPSAALDIFFAKNPGLPRLQTVTCDSVRPAIQSHVASILQDLARLHAVLGRYETVLQRRWLKKSKDQRRKLLLSAWPNVAHHHWPDLHLIWQEKDPAKWKVAQYRDAFMHPEISLEDLTAAKPLLLMLESRSRNTPATFADSDWNRKEIALQTHVVVPALLYGWIMLMRDDAYGSLQPHTLDSWHTLKYSLGVSPGIGMLILEAQQRLMRFLVTCSELILHDLHFGETSPHDAQLLPSSAGELAGLQPDAVDLRPTLDAVIHKAPYRTPVQFDFGRLEDFVHANWAEVEDHIWGLREDPSYFLETIQTAAEEFIQLVRFQEHRPDSWSAQKNVSFYNEVLPYVLHATYTTIAKSADLWSQVKKVVDLGQKHEARMKMTEALPKEFLIAIALLEAQLTELTNEVGMNLKSGVCASPQLRKYFVVKPRMPGEGPRIIRVVPRNVPPNDYFLWIITQLVNPLPDLDASPALLNELQSIIQSDMKQKQRFTSTVAGIVSSLSMAHEIRRQVNLLSMGPNGVNAAESPLASEALQVDVDRRNKLVDRFQEELGQAEKEGIFGKLCLPLTKFYHPSDKRRTATTVNEMCDAEAHLDSFWEAVDRHYVRKTGETLNSLFKEKITSRELNRTAPWHQSYAILQPKPKHQTAVEQDAKLLTSLLEERSERTLLKENQPSSPKSKTKTRGKAASPTPPEFAPDELLPADAPAKPLFKLDKRAYKVFSTIFRLSTKDGVPSELPWSDFVHAMTSIGFAVQSLDGSAWIFSPADESLGLRRSIILHEPHPMSKVPYLIAKRIGRRLSRAFGWDAANFVRE